jgi:CRISPR-associated endoribonuclease Cas6
MESGFPLLHDKKGYKPFCFSNIFPYGDMKQGDIRHFIIASPSNAIIENIASCLQKRGDMPVHIGDCAFDLDGLKIIERSLPKGSVRLSTATPILLRIPEYNYDLYAVPEEERRSRYVYWRPQISFEAFIKQLTVNLIKKYNHSNGTTIGTIPLFQEFLFKKLRTPGISSKEKVTGLQEACGNFHGATWTKSSIGSLSSGWTPASANGTAWVSGL